MGHREYRFVTTWRVAGTVEEVTSVLRDGAAYSRWWPAVYLESRAVSRGAESGLGYVTELHSKGWLPYSLRWRSTATEVRHPHGFTIDASGDFMGRGIWVFRQEGPWVSIAFDWRVKLGRTLLRWGASLLGPLFESNHRWAMGKGEESLRLELARRRRWSTGERAAVPPPPRPAMTGSVAVALAGALVLGVATGLFYRARRRAARLSGAE